MLGGLDQIPGGLATDQPQFDATSFRGAYRIDDIDEQIKELNSQEATFYRLLRMFRRGPATFQPAFQWMRTDVPAVSTRLTAAANSSATTLYVQDSTIFQPGMLLFCQRTGELMEMSRSKMTSATSIAITTRGMNGSAAAAVVAGDVLVAMGVGLAEHGTATPVNHQLPIFDYNYVSFFSLKVGVTELQQATAMKYNIDFPTEVRNAWFKLNRQVNMHILHGRRSYVDDGTYGRFYYTNGFMHQIQTNVLDLTRVQGILTWPVLNHFLHNLGEPSASSPGKILICGSKLYECLQHISYNKVSPSEYSSVLGTQVTRVVSTQGLTMDFVLDRHSFPQDHAGNGIVVDMNHVQLREHRGFPFGVRENIQANDAHSREDEIYGSAAVQVEHEEVHGIIKGASGIY
jgi:hypothetical protein